MKTTVELVHRKNMRCEAKVSGASEVFRIDSTKYKGKSDYRKRKCGCRRRCVPFIPP
jgi:hypothetical protein